MNKNDLVAIGLTEEQVEKVLKGFEGHVPRERFNEVNEAKKRAEELVNEREKQIESLKKATGDTETLKAQIEKLQGENKLAKEQYEADIKALKINGAIDAALTASGAKNLKAAKALLNMDEITLDGDTVKGIDSQIKALLKDESSNFLFKQQETTAPAGMRAGEGAKAPEKTPAQMNYSELCAFMEAGGKID